MCLWVLTASHNWTIFQPLSPPLHTHSPFIEENSIWNIYKLLIKTKANKSGFLENSKIHKYYVCLYLCKNTHILDKRLSFECISILHIDIKYVVQIHIWIQHFNPIRKFRNSSEEAYCKSIISYPLYVKHDHFVEINNKTYRHCTYV